MENEQLWNIKELAEVLKVKPSTIYSWSKEGKFKDGMVILSDTGSKKTIRFIPSKIKKIFGF